MTRVAFVFMAFVAAGLAAAQKSIEQTTPGTVGTPEATKDRILDWKQHLQQGTKQNTQL